MKKCKKVRNLIIQKILKYTRVKYVGMEKSKSNASISCGPFMKIKASQYDTELKKFSIRKKNRSEEKMF